MASRAGSSIASVLRAAFLPEGFPESVSPDYLGFQAWDTVQALSSYVRGMLTSQAIMRGVGVGQQAATPLAAVFTFFLRDLAGMLGGIVFAYTEGSGFDSCAKQWRLFADVVNDIGMTVELASPLLPRAAFLPIACFGALARSVTGVAGGATRAALTQHFALRGNAADVAAKEQSQETATTIAGMALGMALTHLTAHSLPLSWLVFTLLTALHVAANVAALRRLVLAGLNGPRLELLADRYLTHGSALSPSQVAGLEDLTPPPFRSLLDAVAGRARQRPAARVHYGSRLAPLLRRLATASPAPAASTPPPPLSRRPQGQHRQQRQAAAAARQLLARQGRRRYLLLVVPPPPSYAAYGSSADAAAAAAASDVHVVLHRAAAPSDCLRAFVHAHCLAACLRQQGPGQGQGQGQLGMLAKHVVDGRQNGSDGGRIRAEGAGQAASASAATAPMAAAAATATAERAAEEWMAAEYGGMVSALASVGWRTSERIALPRPAWTAEWGVGAAHEE